MREKADEPRHIEALLALGHGTADDHVLDIGGIELGALDEGRDHLSTELVRPHPRECALLGEMKGRAGVTRDDDVLHEASPSWPAPGAAPCDCFSWSRATTMASSALSSLSASVISARCRSSSAIRSRPLASATRSCSTCWASTS